MHKNKQTRKIFRDIRNDPNLVTVKITGPTTDIVAEIQDLLLQTYGDRVILSPILRSVPSGFHAFVSIMGELR